jgi:tetratricopeptide (TPR) repeat protein
MSTRSRITSSRLALSRIGPERAVLYGALLAVLAYCQDVRYDFILDDVPLILMNETITSWHNWKRVFVTHIASVKSPVVPLAVMAVHYRPVYILWQMLNEQIFGAVLPWWHVTSLLLHVGAIFLVYQVGLKLLKERWTAALAALLFAFHPIHVESVSYVTASTDLLVTLFALIAFLAYGQFREHGGARGYYFASIVAASLAMLSKETAVMFPWLLVAYEALREVPSATPQEPSSTRRTWARFVWTLPFFAVVAAYTALRTLLFGLNAGPGPGGSRLAALVDIPLVLIVYLRNLFWPLRLSFFYPVEWVTQWTLVKGAAFIVVVAAAIFLWNFYRDRPGLRLQLLWAAILFVPALLGAYTFVREDWVHDRHMYLVSVPICFIVAALLTDRRLPRRASVVVSSVILAVLLVGTAIQVPRFKDDATIYASALRVAPSNVLARNDYAWALWMYGRHEEGLREFRIASDLSPRSAPSHYAYASALSELGRDTEAAAEYERALQWSPGPTPFRAFLLAEIAGIELKNSQADAAAAHLHEALQIAPQIVNYHAMLAAALNLQGRTAEAEEQMRLEAGIREQLVREQRAFRE